MSNLQGIQCDACSATFFPVADRCPRCASPDVAVVAFAGGGVVEAATAGGGASVGEVRLDEGVLVLARLDGEPLPDVGTRVAFAPVDGVVRFERS